MAIRLPAMPVCYFGAGSTIAHAPLSLAGRLFNVLDRPQVTSVYVGLATGSWVLGVGLQSATALGHASGLCWYGARRQLADAFEKLGDVKWLGQVVVGTSVVAAL